MRPAINVVKCEKIPILEQLRWEEALLRADTRNWCILNIGSPRAIVLGISGHIDLHIHREKLISDPIPLIRRFSGGGTVVVDEETIFVTLICQASSLPFLPFPRPILEWTADLYDPLFLPGLFQLQENDYAIGVKKWGGNAQSIIKNRWLHHSTLLWNYQLNNMQYLTLPPKMPSYRQGRTHDDFLCRLRDYHSSVDSFLEKFLEQLQRYFLVQQENLNEIKRVAKFPHRRATIELQVE